VSRTDLARLQQAVRTTKSLLPEVLNGEVMTAMMNVHALSQGDLLTELNIIVCLFLIV